MSLETYQEARTWAKAIRDEVLERRMPPWPAAPGFGDFSNDRSLTPIEVELLTAWAMAAHRSARRSSPVQHAPTLVRQTSSSPCRRRAQHAR